MEDETKAQGTPEEAAEDSEVQAADEASADAQSSSEDDAAAAGDESMSQEEGSEFPDDQAESDEQAQDHQGVVNPEDASEEDAEASMMAMLEESGEGETGGSSGVHNPDDASEEDAEAAMMAMLQDLPSEDQKASADDINFGSSSVSPAEFQQLQQPAGKGETRNLELLLDVNLPISIELGRTKMTISDILALGPGSVVELNKLAGEPVDLLVNGRIVARGEVVVIDENFGVRITQLLTTEERLKVLGEQS
jgi:flagellar motor switch protein FliN/FliY